MDVSTDAGLSEKFHGSADSGFPPPDGIVEDPGKAEHEQAPLIEAERPPDPIGPEFDINDEMNYHHWLRRMLKFLGYHPGLRCVYTSTCHILINVILCLPAIASYLYSHVSNNLLAQQTTRKTYENDGTLIALVLVSLIHAAPLVSYCLALYMIDRKQLLKVVCAIVKDSVRADDDLNDEQTIRSECGKYTNNLLKRVFPWATLYFLIYVALVVLDTMTEPTSGPENPLSFLYGIGGRKRIHDGNAIARILYIIMDCYPFLLMTIVSLLFYAFLHSYEFRLSKFPKRMKGLRPEQVTREFHMITRDKNRIVLFKSVSQFLFLSLSTGVALPAVYAHYHFALKTSSSREWMITVAMIVKVTVGFLSPWIFILSACLHISDTYKAIAEEARRIQVTFESQDEKEEERHQARWGIVTDYLTGGPYTGFHLNWLDMVVSRSQALLFLQGCFAALLWAAFSSLNDYRVRQIMMSELTAICNNSKAVTIAPPEEAGTAVFNATY
ncbi:uncharacterized protein [Ptychodera flava]|uniref:uncharacterized protein n=1 Tax=Ptychodera flava TaxID=63121 RepID=UPI00396A9731